MIDELRITDLGVISEAALDLHPGLTVVTGETGAGKTMIVSGLDLLLGARADPKVVRVGASRARVEGTLTIDDPNLVARVEQLGGETEPGGHDGSRELVIARHVTSTGRSRAYVGGTQVPVGTCAELAGTMITVHGQSEQLRLTERDRQRELLDSYAGEAHRGLVRDYRERYTEHRLAAEEHRTLVAAERERARETDLLRFGLDEIERVAPAPGEDVALAGEALRMESLDDLQADARRAMEALAGSEDESGGALAGLAGARTSLARLAAADPGAADFAARAFEAAALVTELTGELARFTDDLAVEPGRLEQIAARRHALAGLTRKYGSDVDAVLAWAASAADRLARLEATDDRIASLAARLAELDSELSELAGRVRAGRAGAAATIAERVRVELTALAMPHARLQFTVGPAERGPGGADQVDLVFSANPGSTPRPIGKVASGGELSRVRLALEVVLAAGRTGGSFVFDEVDAGVGGRVAVEIGRRLAALAEHAQVVVVTHLAQVAAFADRHFVVVKSDDGQVTTSGVRPVADADRTAELARMMAGLETTESALAHAGELLDLAGTARQGTARDTTAATG